MVGFNGSLDRIYNCCVGFLDAAKVGVGGRGNVAWKFRRNFSEPIGENKLVFCLSEQPASSGVLVCLLACLLWQERHQPMCICVPQAYVRECFL